MISSATMSNTREAHQPARSTLVLIALTLTGCLAACGPAPAKSAQASPGLGASVAPLSPLTGSTPATTPRPSPKISPHASPSAKPAPVGTPGKFVFPVVGHYAYAHTHHDYPATDIITNCGNEVRAVTSGVILEVTRVDKYKASVNAGATRGGLSVSIKGDDGIRYYGSHLEEINQNIQPGVRVRLGEMLGKVGHTGDAGVCHLHFGISPVCSGTGDWWIQRGVLYPWPYLDSWRKGGEKSPVAAITAWQKKNGCPKKALTDP
jgi:peptidoglycan LD-endopeptidase LytH